MVARRMVAWIAAGSLGLLGLACYQTRESDAKPASQPPRAAGAVADGDEPSSDAAIGGYRGRGDSGGAPVDAASSAPRRDASAASPAADGDSAVSDPRAAVPARDGTVSQGNDAGGAPSESDPAPGGMHGAPEVGFPTPPRRLSPTTPGLRLAFLGDQSMGPDATAVLQLVARERADAVVHLGDFAYDLASPDRWQAQIDAVLGPDFPYFASVGNHDVGHWPGPGGFAEVLAARVARVPEARCNGELGVNSICRFRGLTLALSGVGTYGQGHEAFLDSALSQAATAFRLCIWHKNQHDMQVGPKGDEVGWEAYRICARHGALIVTAHEHSYARTRTLEAISDRSRGHGATGRPDLLILAPGSTAVVVTGLGGHSARPHLGDHDQDSWWASVYAQNYQLQNDVLVSTAPSIQFGALFIDFNVEGDPFRAIGYFKTTDGQIQDRFVVQTSRYAR